MSSGTLDPAQRSGSVPPVPRWLRLDGQDLPTVGTARVYVCGITPYDVTHLGHAATFVWADVLGAVLGTTGASVNSCRNVTDVDDVLTAAAQARGRYYDELALVQEAVFDQDMRALRVATPQAQPHARHHISAVVQLAAALLDRGAAYERDGTVWFRGASAVAASGIGRDEALGLSEAYGDQPGDPAKDDPFDVAVWRPSPEGHPAWPSPWGWGRPGWHAECAAMALTVHGPVVDVLVGGEDLRFPHHVLQSAMAEAASGIAPFRRAGLHVGQVRLDGEKMAKSTGNLVLVADLLQTCAPAALRLLLIDRPVDEAWDFDVADLDGAAQRLERLFAAAARGPAATDDAGFTRLEERLLDGLDVRGALDLAEEIGGDAARRLIALLRLA